MSWLLSDCLRTRHQSTHAQHALYREGGIHTCLSIAQVVREDHASEARRCACVHPVEAVELLYVRRQSPSVLVVRSVPNKADACAREERRTTQSAGSMAAGVARAGCRVAAAAEKRSRRDIVWQHSIPRHVQNRVSRELARRLPKDELRELRHLRGDLPRECAGPKAPARRTGRRQGGGSSLSTSAYIACTSRRLAATAEQHRTSW